MMNPFYSFFTIIFLIFTHSQAQTPTPTLTPGPPPPPPPNATCNGIFLSYSFTLGRRVPPILTNPEDQSYRFESTLVILNNGLEELKSWRVFVGFRNRELLVSASNAVLSDGGTMPGPVGNGTVFAGYPTADLKTGVETAGDLNQMSARVQMVGTQFGVGAPGVPMPGSIRLANDGFICPRPTMQGTREMHTCCIIDANFRANITEAEEFLPRQDGDLTIMYDVLRTYDTNYWADVTISNHNPLGRLDDWRLSWDWMREEFIFNMRGAYPSVRDSSACIFGTQGQHFRDMDFSTVLNCERRPTIIDLPLTKTNDTNVGMFPNCCRNGTILPQSMDPTKSVSGFQINVFKMPPFLNRSDLSPPQNWRISGRLNPDYQCGPPTRVSPSQFPDPSGLPSDSTAVASWQVVCNITQHAGTSPRCCVSFSAYYNESIIPCRTCACGCPSTSRQTCSTRAPAMFLPSQALLVPYENRTRMAVAWAELQHRPIPNPLPCGDNCGVSINWHLATNYRGGWSARMTIFNWDDTAFVDWFAAIELNNTAPGFEAAYSFNGTTLDSGDNTDNTTIFMQGLEGLNYLVGETDAPNPQRDPRIPGKQQSVISFTKKNMGDVDIVGGDGFPTKVFFNGEECSLPRILPISSGYRMDSAISFSVMVAVFIWMLLL